MELYKYQGTKTYNLVATPTVTISPTIPETIPTLTKFSKRFEIKNFLFCIFIDDKKAEIDVEFKIGNLPIFMASYDCKFTNYFLPFSVALAESQSLEINLYCNVTLANPDWIIMSAQYELNVMGV